MSNGYHLIGTHPYYAIIGDEYGGPLLLQTVIVRQAILFFSGCNHLFRHSPSRVYDRVHGRDHVRDDGDVRGRRSIRRHVRLHRLRCHSQSCLGFLRSICFDKHCNFGKDRSIFHHLCAQRFVLLTDCVKEGSSIAQQLSSKLGVGWHVSFFSFGVCYLFNF